MYTGLQWIFFFIFLHPLDDKCSEYVANFDQHFEVTEYIYVQQMFKFQSTFWSDGIYIYIYVLNMFKFQSTFWSDGIYIYIYVLNMFKFQSTFWSDGIYIYIYVLNMFKFQSTFWNDAINITFPTIACNNKAQQLLTLYLTSIHVRRAKTKNTLCALNKAGALCQSLLRQRMLSPPNKCLRIPLFGKTDIFCPSRGKVGATCCLQELGGGETEEIRGG